MLVARAGRHTHEARGRDAFEPQTWIRLGLMLMNKDRKT